VYVYVDPDVVVYLDLVVDADVVAVVCLDGVVRHTTAFATTSRTTSRYTYTSTSTWTIG